MFTHGNNRSSPGLRALLGRFLYGLLPHRLFQLVGAAWSYLMGPWEASSFLPSEWLIHRSVRSGDLPEVLEVLGLRPGSWEELGECLDELGSWNELIRPKVGVELDLLKSWKGVSAGKDVESALNELTTWQETMVHNNMQVFWEPGLTWKDVAELKQDKECNKTASASHTFSSADGILDDATEPCKVKHESPNLGIISSILNVQTGGVLSRVEWKHDQTVEDTVDNSSQSEFEIQHIRNKRLAFLQQNKTLDGLGSDAKEEDSEREQCQTNVQDLPDPVCFFLPASNLNLGVSLSECLESRSRTVCAQSELVSNISLAQGDVVLEFPEMIEKCSSCDQLPVVVEEAHKSGHFQYECPPSLDKDQGYHSLEYWQYPPLQQKCTTANIETPETCDLRTESALSLPIGLPACPFLENKNEDQNSDTDSDLKNEIPASSVTFCTNKHIGYILGTVASDEDDDISTSSSDKWDKEHEEDDGFDSEGMMSVTDSETDVPEDVLWNYFCSADPYNLQNFTASLQTGAMTGDNALSQETLDQHQSDEESWCESNTESDSDSDCSSADEEENLKLWNAFLKSDDPYNLLYFKAPVQTSDKKSSDIASTYSNVVCRRIPNHMVTLVTCQPYELQQLRLKETNNVPLEDCANLGHKKVTFHENVTIHYVCNEEERKGHWEELARDRCRFQRRIKETEFVIGHCLTPDHRQRAWERMQGQWGS